MKISVQVMVGACLLLAVTVGCKPSGDQNAAPAQASNQKTLGNVAIIDLDAVAAQLGHTSQIQGAIQKKDQEYAQQLGVIKATYEQELGKIKSQSGESPTPEQSKTLVQSANRFNRSMQQNAAKAKRALSVYQTSLVQQYRDQVKQVAQEVASERGLGIILTKSDTVLAHDMTVDITGAVVERIRAKQASAAQAAPAASTEPPESPGVAESPSQDESAGQYRR